MSRKNVYYRRWGGIVGYFIALLSTLFVVGSVFLFLVSQIFEYGLTQRPIESWIYEIPIAHRGLFDHPIIPENSLSSFKQAIEKGYAIELDVRLGQGGQVVVFHDEDLERATGVNGAVSHIPLENLRLWNSQESIPTLKETLTLVNGRVPLYIELK